MERGAIHDFAGKMAQLHARLRASSLLPDNVELILGFERLCAVEGLSTGRRWKLCEYLYVLAKRYHPGSFRSATAQDLHDVVLRLENSSYAPWTKHDFKVALRKFFRFVVWGEEAPRHRGYPDIVAGISIRVARRDQVRVQRADILTEDEALRVIEAAPGTQERALVSMLYELGARIGEIGCMTVGSLTRDAFSLVADVNGKTGPRSVRIIMSAAAVAGWLGVHPRRDDPTAPLWGSLHDGEWRMSPYWQLARTVGRCVRLAGITKRVSPHRLRHARANHLLASNRMNETQIKPFLGLVDDSSQIRTYAHVLAQDANNAALRMYGLATDDAPKAVPVQRCGLCSELNLPTATRCAKCSYALTAAAADDAFARTQRAQETLGRFLQQPEIEQALRRLIADEVRQALAQSLPLGSAPPAAPKTVGTHPLA